MNARYARRGGPRCGALALMLPDPSKRRYPVARGGGFLPRWLLALALLALVLPLRAPEVARAAACVVTSSLDGGPGSLRAAIGSTDGFSNCADITFALATPATIALADTLPPITRDLRIAGPVPGGLTVRGNGYLPVLTIAAPGRAVSLSGLTLTGGRAASQPGGNLRITGGTVALTDVALTNAATAVEQGGAGAYIGGGTVTLTRVTISGNAAPGGGTYRAVGAGLLIDERAGDTTVTIADSTIVGNTATSGGGGGGLGMERASGVAGRVLAVQLLHTTVGTLASPNWTIHGDGGGIFNSGGALTLVGCTVVGNSAFMGGGLYLDNFTPDGRASATLIDTTVSRNTAYVGGGLAVGNAANGGVVGLTLTTSAVSGNRADYAGGGLSVENGGGNGTVGAVLVGSTVGDNRAVIGGGLHVRNSGGGTEVLVLDGTISGNQALDGDGGGLFVANNVVGGNAAVTLTNSTLSGNAANNGGGLYVAHVGSSAALHFTTVTGNAADNGNTGLGDGGGLFGAARVEVASSIVAGNRKGAGTANDCGGTITSGGHTLWGDRVACPAGTGDHDLIGLGVPLTGVLDPLLADNGGPTRTHALVAGSPALDLGDAVACAAAQPTEANGRDQRGSPRPQGRGCDAGAYELQPAEVRSLLLTTSLGGDIARSPLGAGSGPFAYPYGGGVTLTASPTPGYLFTGWDVDGTLVSWATTITLTLTANHLVSATFARPVTFTDIPADAAYAGPVRELAARGIINGCLTDPATGAKTFCPDEPTLRHQMAALIARAMPGWADETGLPTFTDGTLDTELMTRVATLQRHNVVHGYQAEVCLAFGKVPPCYGPLDDVTYGQALLFIARAMIQHNYWTLQADDRAIYPDQNGAAGALPEDQQTLDHRALVTYVHYAGAPPAVDATPGATFLVAGVARGGWGDPSSRGWFARALWRALDGYFGANTLP